MADGPICKTMTFTIHGVGDRTRLPGLYLEADVFARKVREVIAGLKKADQVANVHRTKSRHRFYISDLRTGSAIVGVTETPSVVNLDVFPMSSVDAFIDCAQALRRGDFKRAAEFGDLPRALHAVAEGADDSFSHIDIVPELALEPVRIDRKFEEQAARYLKEHEAHQVAPPEFFQGTAFDAFDGTLKEVDLRSATWSGLLVLTGSGAEITCTMKEMALEEVKKHLNARVWAEGRAVYSKAAGLPVRLDVSRMRPIYATGDLRRWRGKVTPDERGDNEGDWDGQ